MRRLAIWFLLAVALVVYVFSAAWRLSAGPAIPSGFVWAFAAVPPMVIGGAFLVLKRPAHPIGELLVLLGISILMVPASSRIITEQVVRQSGPPEWMWATALTFQTSVMVGLVLLFTLLVLMPDGRIRYSRERRFLSFGWITVLLPTLALVSNEQMMTFGFEVPGVPSISSPVVVEAAEPVGPVFIALTGLATSLLLPAIALLFMRYRASPIQERKQIRWVLFAGVVTILIVMLPILLGEIGVTPPLEATPLPAVVWVLPFILLPASVVVAVMEPPWLDVDIVIRRSFVYGALSLAILLIYIAVAAAAGIAAGARLGLSIELAVVLTVVIAVLFQPARRRLQAVADRRVFGARPTKYEAVTDFGVTIEQAPEPTELLPRLVETIRRTIRLTWVMAILDDGTRAETGTVVGEPSLRLPVGAGEEQIGEIVCGPKSEGEFDADEVQLVRTLAGQLGLAVMNARLAGRIVNAAESERRRIERNIHDGAQQELVALVAKLAMARSAAAQGGLSPDVVDDLGLEAQRILSDLRELAQGIHPSVLSDGGLLEAVEDRCARLPLEVSLESTEGLRARRFDDDIEGAAYFFVTESLTNVLKHANASRAAVSLTYDDGRLLLRVADDGRGFDPDTAVHNGLAGLRDRFRALGGTVTIASRPGNGTRISASLPVEGP